MLFLACSGKWDIASLGLGGVHYIGLNDKRIEMVMKYREKKLSNPARAYNDVRLMESEAKSVLNRKAQRS